MNKTLNLPIGTRVRFDRGYRIFPSSLTSHVSHGFCENSFYTLIKYGGTCIFHEKEGNTYVRETRINIICVNIKLYDCPRKRHIFRCESCGKVFPASCVGVTSGSFPFSEIIQKFVLKHLDEEKFLV